MKSTAPNITSKAVCYMHLISADHLIDINKPAAESTICIKVDLSRHTLKIEAIELIKYLIC